ncbi:unnamed protein product [Leptosia nina]|uniref:Odorant receptor n=1 Tax=Leptosia nina TaxID=320188 RepID=A0AAV1J8P9_9NEOP
MDLFIEELMLYLTIVASASKISTFVLMKEKILRLLEILESDIFQPHDEHEEQILVEANRFNSRYWKVVAFISYTSNLTNMALPLLAYILGKDKLKPPICSYSFLSDETRQTLIYPIYLYQCLGIHFCMLSNVNIDTFILGLMILVIAQLDILAVQLKNITNPSNSGVVNERDQSSRIDDTDAILKFNKAVQRYNHITEFCSLIENVFSISLFTQFSIASGVICVCLFRFTLPSPLQYYIFLGTYIFIMIIQILVPSWFGTRIMDKSCLLSHALYSCDWTPRCHQFKSSMRIFMERTKRPLSITGWKMFPMSLTTFTSFQHFLFLTVKSVTRLIKLICRDIVGGPQWDVTRKRRRQRAFLGHLLAVGNKACFYGDVKGNNDFASD